MSNINQSSVPARHLLPTIRAGLIGLFPGVVARWRHRQTMARFLALTPGSWKTSECRATIFCACPQFGSLLKNSCGLCREPLENKMDNLELFLAMDISLAALVPHKAAAIALAADRLAETAGMDYEDVKAALAGREALGSTALGNRIAMPRAIAPACLRPALSLVSLATPVDSDAPDDRDVDVVMALIWPLNRAGEFVRFSLLASRIRSLLNSRSRTLASPSPLRMCTTGHVYGLPRPYAAASQKNSRL